MVSCKLLWSHTEDSWYSRRFRLHPSSFDTYIRHTPMQAGVADGLSASSCRCCRVVKDAPLAIAVLPVPAWAQAAQARRIAHASKTPGTSPRSKLRAPEGMALTTDMTVVGCAFMPAILKRATHVA